MLSFKSADGAIYSDPLQGGQELNACILAIAADLANPLRFSLGVKSLNRWLLQSIWNHSVGVRDGRMADLANGLLGRIDRETAAQILALMKCELEEMKRLMLISSWSEQVLVNFMEQIELRHLIGRHEEPESELDC